MASQANKGGCTRLGMATVMSTVADSSMTERGERKGRRLKKKNLGRKKINEQ